MEDIRSKLAELWLQANSDDSEIGSRIQAFWQYIQDNLQNLDMRTLFTVDMPVIETHCKPGMDWKDMAVLLNPSGVIYMRMNELYSKIHNSLEFLLAQDTYSFNMRKPDLLDKIRSSFKDAGIDIDCLQQAADQYDIRMGKNLLVLTASENANQCDLIEQIYAASKSISLPPDWQVVKYIPAKREPADINIPLNMPDFTTQMITEPDVSYKVEGRDLYIHISKPVMWTDPRIIVGYFKQFLLQCYGEYVTIHNFSRIHINLDAPSDYAPWSQFRRNMDPVLLRNIRTCEFCGLSEHNTDIITVDQKKFDAPDIPECEYCTYCYDAMCMYKMNQLVKNSL